jgi:hypothetical protein
MSYDLFAQAFDEAEDSENRRREVVGLLGAFGSLEPDGFCRVRVADGGGADFYVGLDGAHFMVNHFSRGAAIHLIVQAARAGGLVIFGGGIPPALTDARQFPHLPEELIADKPPVLIDSGTELEALISDDADVIRACRHRLLRAVADI